MNFAANLAGGVVSSVVAVLVIEAYIRIRRRYHQRALSNVLGFHDTPCSIIPAHEYEGELYQVVGFRDVFAVGMALATCSRVGSTADLVSSHQPGESQLAAARQHPLFGRSERLTPVSRLANLSWLSHCGYAF